MQHSRSADCVVPVAEELANDPHDQEDAREHNQEMYGEADDLERGDYYEPANRQQSCHPDERVHRASALIPKHDPYQACELRPREGTGDCSQVIARPQAPRAMVGLLGARGSWRKLS